MVRRPFRQNIAPKVDARSNLDQAKSAPVELEHRAFGNIENTLSAPERVFAAESRMADQFEKFRGVPLFNDMQLAVAASDLEAAAGKGVEIQNLAGVLADIDEATGARGAGAEAADVQAFDVNQNYCPVGVCESHPPEPGAGPAPALKALEFGHFPDTGRAPGRPEGDDPPFTVAR